MLTAADATAIASAQLKAMVPWGTFKMVEPTLTWVLPNNAMAPSATELRTDSTARLTWVVAAKGTGGTAESVRVVEYYVDATDGSVVGGDSIS